ncbi:hypothetical protein POVCU2_0089350 [Plasmodium ovale curtisi]|uniref:Uncharacterized protein n=1 Tax=Plasmodium ovale curtisi TaxID=864141 RepID=A0A1A8WNZ2_PLAOA|nr:hypothetical protein POVCU2_0089350 [Plasmodium ovale curtisi]
MARLKKKKKKGVERSKNIYHSEKLGSVIWREIAYAEREGMEKNEACPPLNYPYWNIQYFYKNIDNLPLSRCGCKKIPTIVESSHNRRGCVDKASPAEKLTYGIGSKRGKKKKGKGKKGKREKQKAKSKKREAKSEKQNRGK